ncbi:Aste57867_23420 [Aphanomyces stellatus]|uniref:Aste57867_23420 protein n=1 Tax=Aphanomyces stellatus TaxID=120398 RepID=A0A485LNP4_9STRA|nr:hypothetical protein As57867_023349 [Aphanomyces stellatus]VFU00066.1 Aste57867_23420 [Aphanomyces stellatus]
MPSAWVIPRAFHATAWILLAVTAATLQSDPTAVRLLHDAHDFRLHDTSSAMSLYKQVVGMNDTGAAGDAYFALSEISFPSGPLENERAYLDLLTQSAQRGNPHAQHRLALVYAVGTIIPDGGANVAKSIVMDTFAASAGHAAASMTLGNRAMFGSSVPRSCHDALAHYRRAATIAAATMPSTPFNFRPAPPPRLAEWSSSSSSSTFDFHKLVFLASVAQKQRDGTTLVRIAKLLLQPHESMTMQFDNYALARSLLRQALEWGPRERASALLGLVYAHGWGVDVNATAAHAFFHMSPQDANSLHGLGHLSLQAHRTHDALQHFQAAAKLGHVDAIYQVATLLAATQPQTATRYLTAASNSGHVPATFALARDMNKKINDDKTCSTLVGLYKRVAEGGLDQPLLALAWAKFLAAEYATSYWLYRLVAQEGYEVAQTNAAWLVREGYVHEHEPGVVTELLEEAARQGSGYAQLELGHMAYAAQEYDSAMTAYSALVSKPAFRTTAVAYKHVAPALFQMGLMFEMGHGVPLDRAKALDLYTRASQVERRFQWPVEMWIWKWWLLDLWAAWVSFCDS